MNTPALNKKPSGSSDDPSAEPNWSILVSVIFLAALALLLLNAFYPGFKVEVSTPTRYVTPPTLPAKTPEQPVQSPAQTRSSALADASDYGYSYGKQWAPLAAKLGVLSAKSAPSNLELNELANIQWATYSTLPDEGRPKIAAILDALGPQADYYKVKEVWQAGFKRGVAAGLQPEIDRHKRDRAPAF